MPSIYPLFLVFRVQGLRVSGFRVLGFRGLGLQGFRGLGSIRP